MRSPSIPSHLVAAAFARLANNGRSNLVHKTEIQREAEALLTAPHDTGAPEYGPAPVYQHGRVERPAVRKQTDPSSLEARRSA